MSFLINPYVFTAIGPTDPYYSSVSLLLHCDGTNGSTSFPDNSPSPKTITANGNASVDTSIYKYGTGSLKCDGNGDYLSVPANNAFNFGTGDFTIEFWVNFQGSGQQYMMDYSQLNTSVIFIQPSNGQMFVYNGSFIINVTTGALNLNQWYYIALTRSGGTWTLYKDAVSVGQATGQTAATFGSSTYNLYWGIAGNGGLSSFAHFDEIRITKGVARSISSVPTAPFPNS